MKYILYFSLFIVVSCSNTEEKPTQKYYSDDTNRAFEMIERGGSYYLKKPDPVSTPPQIARPQVQPKKIVIDEIPAPVKKPVVKKASVKATKVDERVIEINQNLAFYCMKHRKDHGFSGDEGKCMNFVNNSLEACQREHNNVTSKLLTCIKTKLKNRR